MVRGIVHRVGTSVEEDRPLNVAKMISFCLIFVGALPFALALLALSVALRLVAWAWQIPPGAGGGHTGVVFRWVLDRLSTRDRIPLTDYTIAAGTALIAARHRGAFAHGQLNLGDEVTLRGNFRAGTLWITGGRNETLNAALATRTNTWVPVAWVLGALVFAEGLGFVMLAGAAR